MTKYIRITFIIVLGLTFSLTAYTQKPQDTEDWTRKPEVITPSKTNKAPSDAIILYSGKQDAEKWQHGNGDALK